MFRPRANHKFRGHRKDPRSYRGDDHIQRFRASSPPLTSTTRRNPWTESTSISPVSAIRERGGWKNGWAAWDLRYLNSLSQTQWFQISNMPLVYSPIGGVCHEPYRICFLDRGGVAGITSEVFNGPITGLKDHLP